MDRPSEFARYWGMPFTESDVFNGEEDLFPSENYYYGNEPIGGKLALRRHVGGEEYDINLLKLNFKRMETHFNHFRNENFKDFGGLSASRFKGMDGKAIMTQDMITTQPEKDMTNILHNRIPRLDANGALPMPAADEADSSAGKIGGLTKTCRFGTAKDKGYFVFRPQGSAACWISRAGWANSYPSDLVAATKFEIVFSEDLSLWIFYIDSHPCGIVDGNVETSNFKNGFPNENDCYATTEAYIDLDETNWRILFNCQTSEDSAIKGVGYIDDAGYHDGAP